MLNTIELAYGATDKDHEATCDTRVALDRDIWWLATPLFGDSLNYRVIEHVARAIRNDLVSDFARDVHYDLRQTYGGDAVHLMRMRYGWPLHTYWGGSVQDAGHESYLRTNVGARYHAPPYVSTEYSRDAMAAVPTLNAARAPYSISDDAFAIDRQPDSNGDEVWPQEFFMHPNGIVLGIRTQQRVLLRRDLGALLVIASTLPVPPAESEPEQRVSLRLYSSISSDSLRILSETPAGWGERAFISGLVQQPTVIGLEVQRGGARIAGARSRFGVPEAISNANAKDACAMSEPVLVDAEVMTGSGMRDLERGMLSDTHLRKPTRLGVMWESYGTRLTDSATLRVRVSGLANRSGMGRIAQAMRILGRESVAIEVSWREPAAGQQVEVIEAEVPTLSRQLVLDVSSLRSGSYEVQLSMTTKTCESTSPAREFGVSR